MQTSEILTIENLVLKIFGQSLSQYHFRYHSENIFSVNLDTLSVKFTDSVSTPYLDSNQRLFLNENGKLKMQQKISKTILYPVSEYSEDLLTLLNFYSFDDLLSEFGTQTMNHWLTPFKDFTTTYFIENDNIVSYLNEDISNYILKDKNLLGRNIEKEIDEYKEILSRE